MSEIRSKQAKKIAILLPNLGGGGAERVALSIARDLSANGHDVDLVLVEATGELLSLVPKGVRVVDLQAHRLVAALPALVRYLRDERPDTLQAHMWPLTVIAVMAHRLTRSSARLVVSDHAMLSLHMPGGLQRLLVQWTTRLFYPLADVRTACSNLAAEDLSQLSAMRRDRFDVLYNPISPPGRIASTPEVEALWGQAGARLITVGSLKPEKNHALLLRAFARIADRQAKLMILGEGQGRIGLERLAAELGLADRLLLPGFALDPWPYLASADLFVLSSDYEGFPLVLAEAMHAGLRIVSTDCRSGPAEMTDNGRFGRLVPCGDVEALAQAIDAALKEEARPEEMRAQADRVAGAAAIERYSRLLA
jgi:glycosyltransferase involved in cell wall biosynthesis